MERAWMTEKDAKKLLQDITGSTDDATFMHMVAKVDKHLATIGFKLARLLLPLDNEFYVAVVNKSSDEVAKTLGSSFSAPQIAFLKTVLEGIALDPDAENGVASIGSMDANNLAFTQTQATQATQAPATKLSMTEKERLLPKLVEEGWLANVPDRQGTYSIGVRAFLELTDFLLGLDLPPETRRAWERFL
ncbi:g4221 [Coccomyxa viridis]|uniref:Non-structural maintenance of chromosomes element 1 homolog n=1 Tax=Coccomyxa viridis TaxID=1274662 RepID=A0ABP1FPR4_9CHLO